MGRGCVAVGLSGGVDSSVAAYLLKEQGYKVIGVTMELWGESRAAEDAARVAEALGIPHYILDFRGEFKRCVVDYFVEEYRSGRTPNPCLMCNRYIKWEALLRRGRELGADRIATGHYARVSRLESGRYAIRVSATAGKDQSYALYGLTQEQLSRTLLPVGELGAHSKAELREIAVRAGLPTAEKPDSQEICFVPDNDYAGFLERQAGAELPGAGNFVARSGEVLGRHEGITHYTVGQRRGLNLPMGHRVFVTDIRPETDEVVVGENEELFTDTVVCRRLNFMALEELERPQRVKAKIRYNHAGEYGVIERTGEDEITCRFERRVRAATPGQAMVFYDGEYVCAGGIITGRG